MPQTPIANPLADDPHALPSLSERQEQVLSLIVREYVQSGQPVGSKTLVGQSDLGVSSATVRNEMSVLEEHGLIYAPHTSAGRVPTQRGYRYFVQRLLTATNLSPQERRQIVRAFGQAPLNVEEWPRIAAVALARTAQMTALVTPPRAVENQFKHLELINTHGRLVLMVLVMQGGAVQQQVLTLAEPVSQDVLSQTAQIINGACAGLTSSQVRARARSRSDALTRDIGELVADALAQSNQQPARDIYRFGLSENLAMFNEDEAQQLIHVLEEEELLEALLREMLSPDQPPLRIVVAGEGRWENLSHLSMVMSRYGTPQTRGALGVLGPTRMRYGRAVSAVRYVADLLTDLVDDIYRERSEE